MLLGSASFFQHRMADLEEVDLHLNGDRIVFGFGVNEKEEEYYNGNDHTSLFSEAIKSHFMTVAPARSGKGISIIIPNLLLYAGSMVVIDPKGENAWTTAHFRREVLKQKVHILDPWGEVKRRYGDKMREIDPACYIPPATTFNPLSILDPSEDNYSEDLAYLADSIIINQGKDPFFDDSARELVAGLISFLVEQKHTPPVVSEKAKPQSMGAARRSIRRHRPAVTQEAIPEAAPPAFPEPTLEGLRILISKPSSEITGIAEEAQKFDHTSLARRKLGRFVERSKTNDSIISTALTQTTFLDSPALNLAMQEGGGVFDDLTQSPTTIYLVLPVDKLQTFGRWLRLMVSIGIRSVSRYAGKLPLPVLFMLDEFGTIGKLSAVSQAYGLMAGLNMSIWAFLQDLNQLKHFYPDEWETFIANSQAVNFFNIGDQFTAEYFSKMMGTRTVERISVGTAEARKKDPGYSAMADQHYARRLMTPEEIRQAPTHIGFVIGNHPTVMYEKLVYHEGSTIFTDRAMPNPMFYDAEEDYQDQEDKEAAREAAKSARRQALTDEARQAFPDFESAAEGYRQSGHDVQIGWFGSVIFTHQLGERKRFKSRAAFYDWFLENYVAHLIQKQGMGTR